MRKNQQQPENQRNEQPGQRDRGVKADVDREDMPRRRSGGVADERGGSRSRQAGREQGERNDIERGGTRRRE